MSQQKAASLTSSLFARKGKASPASLLISELEAAGAGSVAPAGSYTAANGRSTVNGSRRKPKPVEELPLLAFVEAQAAGADTAADPAETAPPAVEPAPAASLLERGARAWRRANGHAAAVPGSAATPAEEPLSVAAGQPPERADDALPDSAGEPATISGDANVAAIEDAPQEDAPPQTVSQADASRADVLPQDQGPPAAPEEDAAVAAQHSAPAAATAPASEPPAPVAVEAAPAPPAPPSGAEPLPAMPATLALRKAAALRMPPVLPTETAPPPAGAPARRTATLWRSAAVVTLGAALGFGLYLAVAGNGDVGKEPVAAAPTPAAPSVVAALPPAVEAPAATVPPAAAVPPAVSEPPPVSAEAAAPGTDAALPEPSFDIIRIEPDGQSIIAGRAAPGSEWILLNNGSPIAAVRADGNGEWVVLPDSALVPGANAFSLVPKAERGTVTIPAPAPASGAQQPAERSETGSPEATAPVETPRAEAPPPALPKAKPAAPAVVAETFRAAPKGAYEVQLASVRDSADANRERLRLSGAFPDLLGEMDLRVQQASLDGAGVFYRVRSGAIDDLGVARELCRRLETAGQGCLVVRRPEAPAATVAEELPDAETAVRQQAAERP